MTTNFPTVMNANALSAALANSKVKETQGLAGFSFLKIDFESGEWTVGQDSDIVTDEEVLVNTTTIQHGWILWSGGCPNKVFANFTHPLPMPMPAIGEDKPAEGRSFQAAFVDNGDMVAFDTNSYGGRKGVDVLLGKIKAHAADGSQHLYPRVKLTSESYANTKRGGKMTYNPVFEVVAWCNEEGDEEGEPATKIEGPSEEAKAETADPVSEEPAKEAPKRQRRKRKAAA